MAASERVYVVNMLTCNLESYTKFFLGIGFKLVDKAVPPEDISMEKVREKLRGRGESNAAIFVLEKDNKTYFLHYDREAALEPRQICLCYINH